MEAIENNIIRKPTNIKRINKKNTRVDLTPMVDLGFLLITFFVFTTQLSQPTAMNLNMPYDKAVPGDKICASCALTVFLGANNAIQYYEGMPESSPVVKQTSFAPDGIRKIMLQKKKAVQKIRGDAGDFVLIIKPANGSTFQNFVDIVDEVTINNISHYYIDEVNGMDQKLGLKK